LIEEATFTIGETAAMVGVSAHTIRAWERRHLVLNPTRTSSNQRRYTSEDVDLLRQVKHATSARGFSLKLAVREAHGMAPEVPAPAAPAAESTTPSQPAAADGQGAWRAVADLMPELMVLLDAAGRIVDANIAFARAAGLLRGRLRGISFVELVEPYDRAKAVVVYRSPLRQRRGWELNLKTSVVSGLFSFDCWPLRTSEGPVLALIGKDLGGEGFDAWPGVSE
jgi:DNA-binding transcriptional MerR regulator